MHALNNQQNIYIGMIGRKFEGRLFSNGGGTPTILNIWFKEKGKENWGTNCQSLIIYSITFIFIIQSRLSTDEFACFTNCLRWVPIDYLRSARSSSFSNNQSWSAKQPQSYLAEQPFESGQPCLLTAFDWHSFISWIPLYSSVPEEGTPGSDGQFMEIMVVCSHTRLQVVHHWTSSWRRISVVTVFSSSLYLYFNLYLYLLGDSSQV